VQTKEDGNAARGQVVDRTDISAVDPPGAPVAERTTRKAPLRHDVEDQLMIGNDGVRDAERGEMGEEVGGVHGEAPEVESPLLPRLRASSRRRESHFW
jgi:hypothetical protein